MNINIISGEPTVAINTLTQVANHVLKRGHLSNAFLLKRTCSAIMDTLQRQKLECS